MVYAAKIYFRSFYCPTHSWYTNPICISGYQFNVYRLNPWGISWSCFRNRIQSSWLDICDNNWNVFACRNGAVSKYTYFSCSGVNERFDQSFLFHDKILTNFTSVTTFDFLHILELFLFISFFLKETNFCQRFVSNYWWIIKTSLCPQSLLIGKWSRTFTAQFRTDLVPFTKEIVKKTSFFVQCFKQWSWLWLIVFPERLVDGRS